jgi:DoxX-like family
MSLFDIDLQPTEERRMSISDPSKGMIWGGRGASALLVLALLVSASLKLSHSERIVAQLVEKFGYTESAITPIGIAEILCAVLYAVPRTRVFGAILITGYFGGAVATHVRVGDVFALPLVLGILAWVGLFLRNDAPARAPPAHEVAYQHRVRRAGEAIPAEPEAAIRRGVPD